MRIIKIKTTTTIIIIIKKKSLANHSDMYRLEVVAELGSKAHEGASFGAGGIRIRMAKKEEEEKEKPKEDGFLRHEILNLVLVMTRNSNQIVERE